MNGRVLLLLLMSALSVVRGREVKLATLQNAETLYDTTVTPPAAQTTMVSPKVATKCYTPEEAADLCNRLDEEENGSVDINEYIANWVQNKEWENLTDWREYIQSTSVRNKYLLKNNLYTDCTFIVGPENATQEIHAHRLLLLRASKVFEALFGEDGLTKRGPIRVTNVTPSVFTNMINYIYNNDVCIEDFDEACEMISLSDVYELPLLKQHSKAYLWSSLFPNNVWRGYNCAVTNNDNELKQSALQYTQRWTEDTLNDPKFTELPQHALLTFLAQDSLNSSEVRLYEASLRWAIAEATRQGLQQTPEALRTVLGPALKHIRFLTMSPAEFANVVFPSKLLTYSVSLSVILNLNSPGVMPLPDTLCNSTKNRNAPSSTVFHVIAASPLVCSGNERTSQFDVLTTTVVPNTFSRTFNVLGIQIPIRKREPNATECAPAIQHYTVLVLNAEDTVMYSITEKAAVNTCDNPPSGWKNAQSSYPRPDWQLLNVRFEKTISLPNYGVNSPNNYKFKVIFHNSGTYPSSLGEGKFRDTFNSGHSNFENTRGYYFFFGADTFVYSMITN